MMEMLLWLGSKVLFWSGGLLLLGLAIFVHELGHFLAARWLGFKVEVFSIGFGPAIWKRRVRGIEYKVCWIPFGGYVSVPQLDPSGMEHLQGESEEPREELPDMPPWKRIIVSLAGPLGNVVLAVVLAFLIYWLPNSGAGLIDTRVGAIKESSEAWQAGLRSGDRILSVDGKKIDNWMFLQYESSLTGGKGAVTLAFEREGQTREIEVPLAKEDIYGMHLLDGVFPKMSCVVTKVTDHFPAANAGVQLGDVLRTVDGQIVWDWNHFITLIQQKGETPLTLGITRGEEDLEMEMTPQFDTTLGRALVGLSCRSGSPFMLYKKPWDQLKNDTLLVTRLLHVLVKPKNKQQLKEVTDGMGGPFAILDGLQETLQYRAMDAIGFLRMICVNLAILNLLPIPVLDGGHILFALYEVVTRRKPHPRVVAVLVNAFAILLIGLMILLVGRDVVRKGKAVRRDAEQRQQMHPEQK